MSLNILLGVQTTGNGHIVRSRELRAGLLERGHRVYTLFSGPSARQRWPLEEFAPYHVCRGLTFASEGGRIRYLRTAREARLLRFLRDVHELDWRGYDLVISDYEPITAYMAKRRGLHSLGMGHLYAFAHDVPKVRSNPLIHGLMNRFAPVTTPLGMHWHHFGQAILPPSVPDDVRACEPLRRDFCVVYLPFEHSEAVEQFLATCPGIDFHVYTRVDRERRSGNRLLRPIQRQAFVDDLAACRGVICNAGFSLVSEALHLGKRVLVKPLVGQIEQESNVLALQQLALGEVMHSLDAQVLRDWLDGTDIAAQNYPPVIEPVIDWIEAGEWDDPAALARSLWAAGREGTRQPASAEG